MDQLDHLGLSNHESSTCVNHHEKRKKERGTMAKKKSRAKGEGIGWGV